ncbi:MAG: phosphoribosylformylglycinamidine synthase, partial [Deltaproteobacteria bacterium]|nr:phosphoribosylformylglycinamidine synthase [Deltaproteobacteria bacterium]
MPHRIEVALKRGCRDALGSHTTARIKEDLSLDVEKVHTADVYTVEPDLTSDDLTELARALTDPVIQDWSVDRPIARGFDWLIEVGFRPGVTDNIGRTATEAAILLLGNKWPKDDAVFTSRQYLIKGELVRSEVERIATGLLGNPLINRHNIVDRQSFDLEKGLPAEVPRVTDNTEPTVETLDLEVSNKELMAMSKQKTLALSLEEMVAIRDHYRDEEVRRRRAELGLPEGPTDVELEALAQTWSEHCKHKIFASRISYSEPDKEREEIDSLFKTYIEGATRTVRANLGPDDFCLSVFVDNAGVWKFDDNWSIVFKVETHNSPSALDPYGGALTGIVGVNRDPHGTGKGSRLFCNTDVFCLATPFHEGEIPPRLLHPKRVLEGVREGVEHGGNKSGIPTVNGSLVFDERYLGKPLVFCGTGGIMPAEINGEPSHEKEARPGDRVMMVGGRIGKDGIHGATFSSEELHEGSPATAVQIGDPITQKRMTDFLLRARDEGLMTCLTDNGAGGLSSSIGETAEKPGGARIDLALAPLKYQGLQPWEIFLSEAQERMTAAVSPDKAKRFIALASEMGVEATDLGEYTEGPDLEVLYDGKLAGLFDMDFLHDGVPQMRLEATWEPPDVPSLPDIPLPEDYGATLESMLGRLDICSKEYWVRQYDHEVQGGSVVKPLTGVDNDGPSDAAVVRPVLESMRGVAVGHGICPRYSDLDAYHMAACAADEAMRNIVSVGANPDMVAALDNFCWCDPVQSDTTPDGRYKLAQLVRANKALHEICVAYGMPLVSGKDSMKNDYSIGKTRISIPPTLLVTAVGQLEDVSKAVTMDVKRPEDQVYIVGTTHQDQGASQYAALCQKLVGTVPGLRAVGSTIDTYVWLLRDVQSYFVASFHVWAARGLGVTLAETAFARTLGL